MSSDVVSNKIVQVSEYSLIVNMAQNYYKSKCLLPILLKSSFRDGGDFGLEWDGVSDVFSTS